MSMRHIFLMLAVIGLLLAAGPVQAYDNYLLNGADIATGANWSTGSFPTGAPADIGVLGGYNTATLQSDISATQPTNLYVGYDTTGSLAVTNNGKLTASDLSFVGYNAGSNGVLSIGVAGVSTGTVSFTANVSSVLGYSVASSPASLIIGGYAGSNGTVSFNDGSLTTNQGIYVGFLGNGMLDMNAGSMVLGHRLVVGYYGTGLYDQTGGAVSCFQLVVGGGVGGTGTFNVSGGSLTTTNDFKDGWILNDGGPGSLGNEATGFVTINGTAIVTSNEVSIGGDQHYCNGYVTIGDTASWTDTGTFYIARGNSMTADHTNGTVSQTGGTLTVSGGIDMGRFDCSGQYNINGGLLMANGGMYLGFDTGDSGTFATTPDTEQLNVGGTGNATITNLYVANANYIKGLVGQTGGNLNVTGTMYVGNSANSTGEFDLSGGTATIATCNVAGSSGTGTVNISNTGVLNVTNFVVGASTGPAYVYQTGGTVNPTTLTINSIGTYNQSGGVLNMVSDFTGCSGAYNLSGGQLAMNAHNINGVNSFGFSGGTITDAATVSSNITLANGTGATFQQSGAATTTTVSGAIAGSGQLIQAGAGTLDLTGSALSYSGTTTIASGTLKAAYASFGALASAPVNVQTSASKFVIDYTGTAQSTADTNVQSILAASYNSGGGHFASGTIYSPTATAAGKALGWNDNNSNQITVAYTVYGDANLDGAVNGADLGRGVGELRFDQRIVVHGRLQLRRIGQRSGPRRRVGELRPAHQRDGGRARTVHIVVVGRGSRQPVGLRMEETEVKQNGNGDWRGSSTAAPTPPLIAGG